MKVLKRLVASMVDGIINFQPDISVEDADQATGPVPTVTFLRPHQDSPAYLNIEAGVATAMAHLWDLGHRRIGFIGGERIKSPEMPRDPQVASYEEFLQTRNAFDLELCIMSEGRFCDGIAHIEALWKSGVTAIAAANDEVAAGVLSWAHGAGIRTPQELSVVGFDDSELAKLVTPTLTSVRFPYQEIADITADAIIGLVNGEPLPPHVIIEPILIERKSTAPAPQR